MTDEQLIERIAQDPKIMAGKPVIRGTRLTVDYILNRLVHGATENDIIEEYNGLEISDIRACILFAAKTLNDTEFMPLTTELAS